MVKISLSIVTTPALNDNHRQECLALLLQELGNQFEYKLAINDPPTGHYFGVRAAWKMATGDYHIVLEDDVKICRNFKNAVEAIIEVQSNKIIQFGAVGSGYHWAEKEGCSFIAQQTMSWNWGLMMPTETVFDMLAFCEKQLKESEMKWWDDAVSLYCLMTGKQVFTALPNIVDHRAAHHSTVGNPKRLGKTERVSSCFVEEFNTGFNGVTMVGDSKNANHYLKYLKTI